MILIYAFTNQWGTNISRRVLLELKKTLNHSNISYQLIYFHPRQFFQKYIRNNHYNLIIGLGDHSGQGNRIRLETQAKNNYLNQEIYPFSPILLDLNLPNVDIYDSNYFQIASNLGTYNCNWIAYSIQLHLNQHSPNTFQLFLHLPKKQNAALLSQQISRLLIDNHLL